MTAPRPVNFLFNPTTWNDDGPVRGGMVDVMYGPVRAALTVPFVESNSPEPCAVNVYSSHRSKFTARRRPPGEISVFFGHGLADKGWRRPARELAERWGWVFVSGPAWTRRYAADPRFPMGRVVEIGYPKLDPVVNGELPRPTRDGRIRVVWAPTHGGGGEVAPGERGIPNSVPSRLSSWHHADSVLELLPASEFDVVIAPHPRHRPDGQATLGEYVDADVVIADGGSTIYEAWALDIPVVFPTWLTGLSFRARSGTIEADIYQQSIGYHAERPDQLAELVTKAATSGIGGAEQDLIESILPRRYRGISGRMCAEALNAIAHAATDVPHVAVVDTVTYIHTNGSTVTVPAGSPAAARLDRHPSWTRPDHAEAVPA